MRPIPTLKISVSGVRGVVGDSLTPQMVTRFAQAFGSYAGGGRIVIGRDPRTSGEIVITSYSIHYTKLYDAHEPNQPHRTRPSPASGQPC